MAIALLLYVPIVFALNAHGLQGLQGLSFGAGRFVLVNTKYRVSGAGQGAGEELLSFAPHWRGGPDYEGG
jgi:hypothetical protein